jgi:hypothetical protein
VGPVVALVQSFNLILFAVLVKNEELSILFPIAAALGAAGLYLCSRQGVSAQKATLNAFLLTASAATFFSGFSFIMTLIENNEILPALFGARIKLLHQKPSLVNWAGIAATSAALALIAVG